MRTSLPSLLLVLAACLVWACSSSSSSGKTVKDQAGRSCTIPDSGGLTVSCDKAPQPAAGCTGSATACFVQGYAPGPSGSVILGPAAICAACCSGNQSVSSGNDCSPIVCSTLDDCPAHGFTMCTNGGCY